MATYKPFTEITSLPANSNGDVTILEAHLDSAHNTIADVLEYLTQAVWSSGGVVLPGSVTNPSAAQVRVQGRLGVTADARTLLAVSDQSVDLAEVPTGTRCLVVIQAKAGASTSHAFVDATTGESITHSLLSAWGKVEVIQGDSGNYPALPADCVPVAQVTKTGAATLSLDAVVSTEPTPRYADDGGGVQSFVVACSDETSDLATGAAKVTFRMPFDFTLTEVRASLTTAATGSAVQVDVNQNGSSILSTKLTVDASEKTSTTAATPPVISGSALADDAEITIDIDAVGSTTPGRGLKVTLIGTPA